MMERKCCGRRLGGGEMADTQVRRKSCGATLAYAYAGISSVIISSSGLQLGCGATLAYAYAAISSVIKSSSGYQLGQ